MTPRGLLRWNITLRDDGGRPAEGAVPLLIEWGGEHPCEALPASGVALEGIELGGVPAPIARWLGVDAAAATRGRVPAIVAVLSTIRGRIVLSSSLPDAA
jgi:hypothetical protein